MESLKEWIVLAAFFFLPWGLPLLAVLAYGYVEHMPQCDLERRDH